MFWLLTPGASHFLASCFRIWAHAGRRTGGCSGHGKLRSTEPTVSSRLFHGTGKGCHSLPLRIC